MKSHHPPGRRPFARGQVHEAFKTAARRPDAADRRAAGPAREPVVLAGDLNAVPEAAELAPLRSMFADAWTRAGEGPGFTIPVEAPDRRIDYVLTSPEIGARSAAVIATDASDHLPVVADLEIPKR
jgi:endonuclease/exonuclease/phosphatase family metal-dependent hydrolase